MELGAAERIAGAEERLQPVGDADIGTQATLDDVLRVRRLAIEDLLRIALDVGAHVGEKRKRQRQSRAGDQQGAVDSLSRAEKCFGSAHARFLESGPGCPGPLHPTLYAADVRLPRAVSDERSH